MLGFLVNAISGLAGGDGSPAPPPPPPKVDLDEALLRKTIAASLKTMEEFEKQRNRDLVAIMRHEAGNMAGEMATETPPLKGNLQDAKKNVVDDVNSIFRPLQEIPFAELVLAKQWPAVTAYNFNFESEPLKKAYDSGNWEIITKAFQGGEMGGKFMAYDGPDVNVINNPNNKYHKMGRDKNGRLNNRRFHVAGERDTAQSKIDNYAAAASEAIGQMAGGWIKCYIQLNGTGYSLPTDYAKKSKAYTKTKWWGETKEVIIQNELGNFAGYISKRSGKFSGIVDSAMRRVQKRHIENTEKLLKTMNMK